MFFPQDSLLSYKKTYQGRSEGTSSVSIRGTNNQIRNRFYKSIHLQQFNVKCAFAYLQLCNVKYTFIQLQLFHVKFLFSEENIFRKQKRKDVYGRACLVSGFQLNRENDDLCYLRDTNKFLRPAPCART